MADPKFFINHGPFSLEDLAKIAGCNDIIDNGHHKTQFHDVASLQDATANQASFFSNPKYIESYTQSSAGLCIVSKKFADKAPKTMSLLISDDPYYSYALVASKFYPDINEFHNGNKLISDTAKIGKNCRIACNVVIGDNAVIGDNVTINSGSFIGRSVIIGDGTKIASNVNIIYAHVGNNCYIHAGVCIGQDGFGFATHHGKHIKVPQLGRVIIGNDVEIGAGTCIDRGAGPDTIIGDNCIIDNLVQIGHNVVLGKGCILVSMTGISGSTQLGNYVVMGGQSGVAGHLKIGSFVQVAAQSGVMHDIEDNVVVGGSPAIPVKQWHRQTIMLKNLLKRKE